MSLTYEKDHVDVSSTARAPSDDPKKEDIISATVQQRYVGTKADRQDMITLGKKQVLRVRTLGVGVVTGPTY